MPSVHRNVMPSVRRNGKSLSPNDLGVGVTKRTTEGIRFIFILSSLGYAVKG